MAKKSDIAKYFSREFWTKTAAWLIIPGIICFPLEAAGLGVILLVGGGWVVNSKLLGGLTDKDIEDEYKHFAERNFETAQKACGIDERMLVQTQDWFWFIPNVEMEGNEPKYRKGDDGMVRSNTRGICILNYGKDQIFSWEQLTNIETGLVSYVDTSEYYYKDVIGMEIDQGTTLTLRTAGGPKSYMIAGGKDNKESGDSERARTVISAVRQMLREKKKS